MYKRGMCMWLFGAVLIQTATAAPQGVSDSTRAISPVPVTTGSGAFLFSPFDSIPGHEFSFRHSQSLGHFLEFMPGFFLERLGPIGADAAFSRYAVGGGRGAVYLGGVLLNDPQNDRAPLAAIPTTAVGGLVRDGNASSTLPTHSDIEGILRIVEPPPLTGRPVTVLEVSTGDRGLKQRRARFSSAAGKVGIDFSYDELRNDGYSFDSRGIIQGRDFGSSTSRTQSLNLRGTLPQGQDYLFAFRRFSSTFQGDLFNPNNEQRRHGQYGLLQSSVRGINVAVYERGYKVTTRDSLTTNQTSAVTATFPVLGEHGRGLALGVAYEDIVSRQEVGGGVSNNRMEKGAVGASGELALGSGLGVKYGVNVAYQFNLSSGWGGHAALAREIGTNHGIAVEARRSFRLPNLGELFLPRHTASGTAGTTVGGNRNLAGETALELKGRLYNRIGFVENEVRGGIMRVDDAIVPGGISTVTPINVAARTLGIIEDRVRARGYWGGMRLVATGAVEYASGDKLGFFELVPEYRITASLKAGRPLFKNTSSLFVTADYQYTDSRSLPGGGVLGSFGVLNLKLDARLVQAQLYVLWLNALDKRYETISPYLMTPRTLMFGVSWTFLN